MKNVIMTGTDQPQSKEGSGTSRGQELDGPYRTAVKEE